MTEYLILVNKKDEPVGMEEKVKCHLPNGKLHRAFTALIFDESSRLLLGKRDGGKMLWPNCWDGTFASHPRKDEGYSDAAVRRMPEEVGIKCDVDYAFKFEYHVPYKDVGSENEICGTLVGQIDSQIPLSLVEKEISETRWISAEQLIQELKQSSKEFCPWMLIALYLLPKVNPQIITKHKLDGWLMKDTLDIIYNATKIHLADEKWRLV
ncbi:MAG: NUDIX domain-containing protein [Candidatus Nitrosoabyssus spongiisocia]|nr:MAG: NUDIX domain-containing protein [Nitrosopumilaceae archaeon AB1(1)]